MPKVLSQPTTIPGHLEHKKKQNYYSSYSWKIPVPHGYRIISSSRLGNGDLFASLASLSGTIVAAICKLYLPKSSFSSVQHRWWWSGFRASFFEWGLQIQSTRIQSRDTHSTCCPCIRKGARICRRLFPSSIEPGPLCVSTLLTTKFMHQGTPFRETLEFDSLENRDLKKNFFANHDY